MRKPHLRSFEIYGRHTQPTRAAHLKELNGCARPSSVDLQRKWSNAPPDVQTLWPSFRTAVYAVKGNSVCPGDGPPGLLAIWRVSAGTPPVAVTPLRVRILRPNSLPSGVLLSLMS